ncbi:MAG: Brp/Blh family beta-carotene 15,15'-dioxygenase [Sediminibacterium sp.]
MFIDGASVNLPHFILFIMQIKLRIYLLLFAFILCLIYGLLKLNINTQITFLIIVLVVFGVPHGALDLYIDQYLQKSDAHQGAFLIKYVLNILVYSLVWYFFPIWALVIFILITAFHFGEVDWIGKNNLFIHKLIYTLLGLSWILFLLSKNIEFAITIFFKMGRSNISESNLMMMANKVYPFSLAAIVAIYLVLFFFKSKFFLKEHHYYYSMIQFGTLILFAFFAPLWICFAFYFGFWHSLLSFDKIRKAFNIPNTFNGWKELLIKSMPFSIMAWFGFAFVTFQTLNSKDSSGVFTLIFITLSVLALPHLQIFTKLRFPTENK